jgi:hypothetical protein
MRICTSTVSLDFHPSLPLYRTYGDKGRLRRKDPSAFFAHGLVKEVE